MSNSPILILTGFHRSGTSACGNLLSNAGLNLGNDLIQPHIANRKGYFEDMPAVQMHESWLNENNTSWQYCGESNLNLGEKHTASLKDYISKRDAVDTAWGIKDPRLSLFLPVYQKHLGERARFLFIIRPWQSCIESLHHRHSREIALLTNRSKGALNDRFWHKPSLAAKMWLAYNYRLFSFIKNNREQCLLVTQKALFNGAPVLSSLNKLGNFNLDENAPLPFARSLINDKADLNVSFVTEPPLRKELDNTWKALLDFADYREEDESVSWKKAANTSVSLNLLLGREELSNITHKGESEKIQQLVNLYKDNAGEELYYNTYGNLLNEQNLDKLLHHYRAQISKCANTRLKLDLASRIVKHLERSNILLIGSDNNAKLLHTAPIESQQTRLFPKNMGSDKYVLNGIAKKCDWVVLSDVQAPKASLVKNFPGNHPKTIFLSLRAPFDAIKFFHDTVLPQLNTPFVLISGSEDVTIPEQRDKRWREYNEDEARCIQNIIEHPQLLHWYAENLSSSEYPNLSPIPLGLVYPNSEALPSLPLHSVPTLSQRFKSVLCAHRTREGQQWETRKKVSALANGPWKNHCTVLADEVSESHFFELCQAHKFVICVEGGGFDPSPKAWHALLNGAIPIVKNTALKTCYEQLPVVFIDDWNEEAISETNLAKWESELAPFFNDPDMRYQVLQKLGLQFWWNTIVSQLPTLKPDKKVDSHYDLKASHFNDDSHRNYVGGLWEEMGSLQFEFLVEQGLKPYHKLLDVGCGSLRGGRYFIEYLEAYHYHGIDINPNLMKVGREKELTSTQSAKVKDSNFIASDNFNVDFDCSNFDYGLALSVFTHLPKSRIEECLTKLAPKFRCGKFYASVFLCEESEYDNELEQEMGIKTYPDTDPYHYTEAQLHEVASNTGWQVQIIGDFGHPRNQKMALFTYATDRAR